MGGAKDVDLAVAAAQEAFDTRWGLNVPGSERGKLLMNLATLMEKYQQELAAIEALDNGMFPGRVCVVPSEDGSRQNFLLGKHCRRSRFNPVHPLLRRLGGQKPRQGHRDG